MSSATRKRARQKSAAELRAENRLLRRFNTAQAFVSVANNLVRWAGACFIAWCFYLSVASLAGTFTIADIGIKMLTDVKVSQAVAILLGGGGIAYGLGQRRLRKRATERIQGRNIELEKKLDPKRSSSQLTSRGDTRPEDEE